MSEQEQAREPERKGRKIVITLPREVVPKEAKQHVRASVREMLLAFRSVLDSAIECTEQDEHPESRPVRINID
ncbi:MAG: hypothetical protein M1319_03320 [Chloroflexi bacterium]|nr:hypothetical protein [Chloroflexota bacterium]